ncbi:MAG: hypothetical protein ACFFBD_29475 [Candidatus Hodarchaeota archaeon]
MTKSAKIRFAEGDDRQALLQELEAVYGISPKVFDNYDFVVKGRKQKIWIVTSTVKKLDLCGLKPMSYGMYFAKYDRTGLRLTMNGAQAFGSAATKNVIDLSKQQFLDYLAGENITGIDIELEGYVLLRYKGAICGCGKVFREGILSYISKSRRLVKKEGEIVL